MTTSQCRSCGAAIAWVQTESGKQMPLDAEPSPDGNMACMANGSYRVLTGSDLEAAKKNGIALRKSHFATCPNAASHRRKRQ